MGKTPDRSIKDKFLGAPQGRAKELCCYYLVQELFHDEGQSVDQFVKQLLTIIPSGFSHPEKCRIDIVVGSKTYSSSSPLKNPVEISCIKRAVDNIECQIRVSYPKSLNPVDSDSLFTADEIKLLEMLTSLLASHVRNSFLSQLLSKTIHKEDKLIFNEWRVYVKIIKDYSLDLYRATARKLIIYIYLKKQVDDAALFRDFQEILDELSNDVQNQSGKQLIYFLQDSSTKLHDRVYDIVDRYLTIPEIVECIHQCMRDSEHGHFICNLMKPDCSITDVAIVIHYFHILTHQGIYLSDLLIKGTIVKIIRFLLSEQLSFIRLAKDYLDIHDLNRLVAKIISPSNSRGKLGYKSSALFLASSILSKKVDDQLQIEKIQLPRTWHITSDGLYDFLRHNDLMCELSDHKYKDIKQIQLEEEYVNKLFENSVSPVWLESQILLILGDIQDRPLIVRGSSLLGTNTDPEFAGRYASCILTNKGTLEERRDALKKAIIEVYASTFRSAPLTYRFEHGLVDFDEQMGVIIQELVGSQVGDYFFPLLTGTVSQFCESRRKTDSNQNPCYCDSFFGLRSFSSRVKRGPFRFVINSDGKNMGKSDTRIINEIVALNINSNKLETLQINKLAEENEIKDTTLIQNLVSFTQALQNESIEITQDLLPLNTIKESYMRLKDVINTPLELDFAYDGEAVYLLKCSIQ